MNEIDQFYIQQSLDKSAEFSRSNKYKELGVKDKMVHNTLHSYMTGRFTMEQAFGYIGSFDNWCQDSDGRFTKADPIKEVS